MKAIPENLFRISDAIQELHKNVVIGELNDYCVRLAVVQATTYDWHQHPKSDELFIVLEGELTLEFEEGHSFVLRAGDFYKVPAGKIHRTLASARTVNLCIESTVNETVFTNLKSP